jgi:hypothetical protein
LDFADFTLTDQEISLLFEGPLSRCWSTPTRCCGDATGRDGFALNREIRQAVASKPRNRSLIDVVAAGDVALRLAISEALAGLFLLANAIPSSSQVFQEILAKRKSEPF